MVRKGRLLAILPPALPVGFPLLKSSLRGRSSVTAMTAGIIYNIRKKQYAFLKYPDLFLNTSFFAFPYICSATESKDLRCCTSTLISLSMPMLAPAARIRGKRLFYFFFDDAASTRARLSGPPHSCLNRSFSISETRSILS